MTLVVPRSYADSNTRRRTRTGFGGRFWPGFSMCQTNLDASVDTRTIDIN
jgi:hypothetical protein